MVASVEPLNFATSLTGVTKYATIESFKNNVNVNASEWSTDFWTVANGIPMPKNWTLETPELVQPEDAMVFAGAKVAINYNPIY